MGRWVLRCPVVVAGSDSTPKRINSGSEMCHKQRPLVSKIILEDRIDFPGHSRHTFIVEYPIRHCQGMPEKFAF
ncbi:hypothetical protein TNCV_2298241 [Trichonephila clavipes]|nr:hypothetical protein TNCV_2298241 [Trichonephila clavipes]